MFNRTDKWLDNLATKWNINTAHYVVRWGIFMVSMSLSLFIVALSISFFALAASLWVTLKIVAMIALVLGIIGLVKGTLVVLYSVHLAGRWLREGLKDSLATGEDMQRLRLEINNKINSLSKQVNENHSDMVRINAGLVLGMKDMTSDLVGKVRNFRKELQESTDNKK